jgi:hypothetical protein
MLNPAVLGLEIVAATIPTDPLGIIAHMAIAAPLMLWTASNVTVNPLGGVPLVAAGPKVVGTGALVVADPTPLIQILCAAIGILDDPGVAKVGTIVTHYAEVMRTGQVNTALLVAYAGPAPPPSGPVSGTGAILIPGEFDFKTALEVTDAPGMAKWDAFGAALKSHIEANSMISPTMVNAIAGPLTGSGAVT